jgi:hypothetical protein
MGVATPKAEEIKAHSVAIDFQIDRLWRRSGRLPSDSRHANVGTVNERKTVPDRRLPEKMITIAAALP